MRLIDADDLLDRVEWANTNPLLNHGETAVTLINAAPTIDPTKHGHWRYDRVICYYICSKCGQEGDTDFSYCPWCGARMDG